MLLCEYRVYHQVRKMFVHCVCVYVYVRTYMRLYVRLCIYACDNNKLYLLFENLKHIIRLNEWIYIYLKYMMQ